MPANTSAADPEGNPVHAECCRIKALTIIARKARTSATAYINHRCQGQGMALRLCCGHNLIKCRCRQFAAFSTELLEQTSHTQGRTPSSSFLLPLPIAFQHSLLGIYPPAQHMLASWRSSGASQHASAHASAWYCADACAVPRAARICWGPGTAPRALRSAALAGPPAALWLPL